MHMISGLALYGQIIFSSLWLVGTRIQCSYEVSTFGLLPVLDNKTRVKEWKVSNRCTKQMRPNDCSSWCTSVTKWLISSMYKFDQMTDLLSVQVWPNDHLTGTTRNLASYTWPGAAAAAQFLVFLVKARLTTMPSRGVMLVLIMLILSVYILQQNSDIGKVNNFSNHPNLQHILNTEISRKFFLARTRDLRHRIDSVAAMHGRAIRKSF